MRSLIIFIFLLSKSYGLVIYQDGKLIKSYDRKKLIEVSEPKKVNFYNYHNNKKTKYIGISLNDVMKDAGINPSSVEEVVFNCLNGFKPFLNYQLFKNREAYLTYKTATGSPFTRFSQKTKKIIELSPYYLVWKLDDLHFSQREKYSSIYKIQAIDFKTNLFKLPFDNNHIMDGFNTYKRYCISCHKLNDVGGTISSDLMQSKYLNDMSGFINYVINPSKINPSSEMLPFPKFSNQFVKVKNIYQMLKLIEKDKTGNTNISDIEKDNLKSLIKELSRLKDYIDSSLE